MQQDGKKMKSTVMEFGAKPEATVDLPVDLEWRGGPRGDPKAEGPPNSLLHRLGFFRLLKDVGMQFCFDEE
ncbi:hypothetical protein TNCT_659921 [Trichonephila clavata]|uniref:Uncharacterized protein n=1 Tax=Trichonephila clavata TaxID=2740835 RepID=A0A8X6FQE0_TRICU|nr:hypothetical protein TNCT_659921 [Trichonephila clavata]